MYLIINQKCKNAKMQKCKNAKMQKCKNAKMQKCKNAIVFFSILFIAFFVINNYSSARDKLPVVNSGQSGYGCNYCPLTDSILTPVVNPLTKDTTWKYLPLDYVQANSWYDRIISGYDANGNPIYESLQAKIPCTAKINGIVTYIGTVTASFAYKVVDRCLLPNTDTTIAGFLTNTLIYGSRYDIAVYIHDVCFKEGFPGLDINLIPTVSEMFVKAQREILQSTYYYFWPLFEKEPITNSYKFASGGPIDSAFNESTGNDTIVARSWMHFYMPCKVIQSTYQDNNFLLTYCYEKCGDSCCIVSYRHHIGYFYKKDLSGTRCYNHRTLTMRILTPAQDCPSTFGSLCIDICSDDLFAFDYYQTIFRDYRERDSDCQYCQDFPLLLKPILSNITMDKEYDNIRIFDLLGNLVTQIKSNNIDDYNTAIQNIHGLYFVSYYFGNTFIESKSIYFE